jgi:hypothetical protein
MTRRTVRFRSLLPLVAAGALLALPAAAPAATVGPVASSGPISVPVPDATGVPATSVIRLDRDGAVGRVRVAVAIRHAASIDLEVALVSPTGTRVQLLERRDIPGRGPGIGSGPACGADMLLFHPDAPTSIWEVELDTWAGAQVPPARPLTPLVGEPIRGDWTISVTDADVGTSGTLACWAIYVDPTQRPAVAAQQVIRLGRSRATHVGPLAMTQRTEMGSLSRAIAAFGAPTRSAKEQWLTRRAWPAWGLTGWYYTLSLGGETYVDGFIVRGGSWRTQHGLRIGDRAARIRELYPTAERHGSRWWLRQRYRRYGTPGWEPTVIANVARGKVVSFGLQYSAGGE